MHALTFRVMTLADEKRQASKRLSQVMMMPENGLGK